MKQREILIDIAPNGNVTVATTGFSGPACEKATEAIRQALGVQKSHEHTPEYHKKQEVHQRLGS